MRGFSTSFPCGAAGTGLLFLRCAALSGLFDCTDAFVQITWTLLLSCSAVGLLLAGLLTPIAVGAYIACKVICFHVAPQQSAVALVTSMLYVIALGLLGPGAYSMDAKLFGRRRLLDVRSRNINL